MSGYPLGSCWRCWICGFCPQCWVPALGEVCNPGTSLRALWQTGTPLLSPVSVCQLVVPGSRLRSQTRLRHQGQQVRQSQHSLESPDLNLSLACLSGRGEIAPGMKISSRGWEREDYGLPSASIFSNVNNNKQGNDPQVP